MLANPLSKAFLLRNYVVEIQSKGPLSAVKKCIGVGHPLCHSKGRGEDNKKRGGSGQGVAANA